MPVSEAQVELSSSGLSLKSSAAVLRQRARDACDAMRLRLNRFAIYDLPCSLALLYFLLSCSQSFPLTANTGLLNEELKMPQETQSLFYAVTFMPWSLKPLYGLLADLLPMGGFHFRPWLAITAAGSAACYLLMAYWVTSIGGAFGVALLRAVCNAFSELMLGAALVSYARRDGGGSATTLQAAATCMRYLATFACSLVGLYLYPCGTTPKRLADRTVIGLTAAFPASVVFLTSLLPEARDPRARRCGVGYHPSGVRGAASCAGALARLSMSQARMAVLFALALPLQAAALWAQVRSAPICPGLHRSPTNLPISPQISLQEPLPDLPSELR